MKDEIIKKYNVDVACETRVVRHCDTVRLDACRRKMDKTPEGFFSGSAPVAKVGVMTYLMADGSILREFVPPETLFNKSSMDSLKLKPVTNSHPAERRVTSDNAGYRQVGFVGETVEQDSDYLCCNMVITDGSTISEIESGKQELSPGYETELLMQKGVYNGQEYDGIQTARKYNHVAVVDNARGGTDIRMNIDGFESVETENNNPKKENSMKFQIDGIDYEAAAEVVNFIGKLDAKISSSAKELADEKAKSEKLKGELDASKAKCDELEKRDIQKEVNDAVQERLELERVANVVLDSVDVSLDNRSLKVAIIAKKIPAIKIDEKSSVEYINAVLDTVKAGFSKEENDSLTRQTREMNDGKQVPNPSQNNDEAAIARERMVKKIAEASKRS